MPIQPGESGLEQLPTEPVQPQPLDQGQSRLEPSGPSATPNDVDASHTPTPSDAFPIPATQAQSRAYCDAGIAAYERGDYQNAADLFEAASLWPGLDDADRAMLEYDANRAQARVSDDEN